MRRSINLALAACLLLVTSSKAAPTQPEPVTDEEMDRQIGDMLQKLESTKNLGPREKRAVNVLSGLLGGGGGGNFLNELNKGPTYSQLLNSGGSFNKAGLLSGFLGSSSGTAILNRRPVVSLSLGGGAGVIDEDPEAVALRLTLEQRKEHTPLDLGGPQAGLSAHLAIPLRGPLGVLFQTPLLPDPPILSETPNPSATAEEDYDSVYEDDTESKTEDDYADGNDDDASEARAVSPGVTTGPYPPEVSEPQPPLLDDIRRDPIASKRPRKQKGGTGSRRRRPKNGGGGATASASVSDGPTGSDASAAAGGGSDSGSILGLVTPLLGSSSAGAAGGGTDGGAGASVGVSLGGGGVAGGANAADIWRETLALHYRIKSFIFRKLVQLLGSSSGSPQAG